MAQALARARDDAGAPEGGQARALGLEEATRRAPSIGLVAKIVALTILGAGAVFSFGMAWGRSTEDSTAALRSLREEVTRNEAAAAAAKAELRTDSATLAAALRAEVTATTASLRADDQGAAARLKLLEQVAGGLTPAVDRLGVTMDKLAATVDTLRLTVAEQTVEMRHVKDSLNRMEAARDAREPRPAAPTSTPPR